jgi:glycosyltransferase involved in cell wall biosynthesis
VVEHFDSTAFRGALRQTVRKWKPQIAQLEFTQMAQYARDCSPARTVLVEHDVTIDLYRQLLALQQDLETSRQLDRWMDFETRAWSEVDCVVTMSERDRDSIRRAGSVVTIPNGVDIERFYPSHTAPEPARLLFIGSFAHLPNLLALDFFLRQVWPALESWGPVLHVIAGSKHRFYYEQARDRLSFPLDHPGLELEDFVADVRPAYARAAVVIAPLLASAGTNIKIMEAMAMGKAIVSTSAGINGLDELRNGHDLIVEDDPARMAAAISKLFGAQRLRETLGRKARETAEDVYSWDVIAKKQRELYEALTGGRKRGQSTDGSSHDR